MKRLLNILGIFLLNKLKEIGKFLLNLIGVILFVLIFIGIFIGIFYFVLAGVGYMATLIYPSITKYINDAPNLFLSTYVIIGSPCLILIAIFISIPYLLVLGIIHLIKWIKSNWKLAVKTYELKLKKKII